MPETRSSFQAFPQHISKLGRLRL